MLAKWSTRRWTFTLVALAVITGCGGMPAPVAHGLKLHVEIAPGAQTPSQLDWSTILLVTRTNPFPLDVEMRVLDGRGALDIEWNQADTIRGIAFAGRSDGTAVAEAVAVQSFPATGGVLSFTLGDDLLAGGKAPDPTPVDGAAPSLVADKPILRVSAGHGDQVRITNVGRQSTAELTLRVVNTDFDVTGCVGAVLKPGDQCELSATLKAGSDSRGTYAVAYVDDGMGPLTAVTLTNR
jgi:hypothetical protein